MKATKNIDIYLTGKRPVKPIDVVQYDTGIQLVFTVKDFTIPSGATATLYVQKPSGKFVYQEENITVADNTITVNLENQALTEHGKVPYQVTISSESDTITTFTGLILVEKSLKDAGAIESKTVQKAFDKLTAEMLEELQTNAETVVNAEIATIPDDYTELFTKVNESANAIKGKLSGAVIAVDDVSPVEHLMNVNVHSKNHFNYMQMDFENRDSALVDNGDGSITVKAPVGSSAVSTKATLRQLAPTLKEGKIYTLSFNSDGTDKYIYLSASQSGWNNKTARIITTADLDSTVFLYASGVNSTATISNIQIEEGITATEYTPYVDPSTVTVKKHGKNLFPVTVGTYNGVTLSKYNDYYVLNGKATGSGLFITKMGKLLPGTYTLSANNPTHNSLGHIFVPIVQVYSPDTLESVAVIDDQVNGVATATIKGGKNFESRIRYQEGITYNNFIVKPQFELNNTATEYEAYKEFTEHIPTSDGVVSGVTSLSPNMTLLTDTEGVIVECEYNKDTNKVIKKITDALGITI
jgi:hypothetical protein